MKFSEQWLRQRVNVKASTHELVEKMTMAGLEVDNVEPVAADFSGIVVAEVVSCEQHPNADKLMLTKVSTGSDHFQVVCGAPNVRVGIRVPFATVGAVLPGDFNIKKAKFRGIESFGMLCAEEELGMVESSDGLFELPANAPLGQDIRKYLTLDDRIIDVCLTPNRGDCLSIIGLAREVSANFLADISDESITKVPATIQDRFEVNINSEEDCPSYVGRVIKNININNTAPLWMIERLRRSGIRSIDPVVDVTNYVMLELGQPMHSFDLEKLHGSIQVRKAKTGEKLLLLDGQEIELKNNTLVIADEKHVLAIAGVMGGMSSGVSSETRDIFLESAFFNPISIAGKARLYGLHTESSHRFERGIDFQLQGSAIERATALILDICDGDPGPITEITSNKHLPHLKEVTLRADNVTSLLGLTIEDNHIEAMLTRLGLNMKRFNTTTGTTWCVSIPSWRFDISIEEDLIEELGRIYGYNNLPVTIPSALLKMKQVDETNVPVSDILRLIVSRDYTEALSFSFIDPQLHTLFDPKNEAIILSNPISNDLSVMRTSLLPSLVKAVSYNLNRQQSRVRLFEIGQVFIKGGDVTRQESILQEQKIAMVITGNRFPESWNSSHEKADFYDLKGDIEALLAAGKNSIKCCFSKAEHPAMHPGQCAAIYSKEECIGHIGEIHPYLAKKIGVPTEVYLAELKLNDLLNGTVTKFKSISKFPEVRRDIAIAIKDSVSAESLCQAIRKECGNILRDVRVFDVYVGKNIDNGCKSIALCLTLQHDSRTLKDIDVNCLVDRVVHMLEHDFNASIRA